MQILFYVMNGILSEFFSQILYNFHTTDIYICRTMERIFKSAKTL